LINTIKNALEASKEDEITTVQSWKNMKSGLFNIGVRSYPLIPMGVRLKMFQRAFSTRGAGRGWGTYSMRLLTERYLGGRVSFVSNRKERTLFTISIPSLNGE
jgi:sensor histidine kinase regulating citrate/malate metabolism